MENEEYFKQLDLNYFKKNKQLQDSKDSIIYQNKFEEKKKELALKLGMVCAPDENIQVIKVVKEGSQETGLFVTSKQGQFLVHTNQQGELVVVNTQFIKTQWFKVQESQESQKNTDKNESQQIIRQTTRYDEKLENIVKAKPLTSFISGIEQGSLPPPNLNSPVILYGAVGDVGASLGYCLANINNYRNTQEFMQDFGYITAMNGSVTLIVQKLPIFGPILLLGGMGYTALKIYNNKCANSKTKMQQVGKIFLNAGTSIGGSLSGAALGQAIVPIPVIGALLGGIIGGFIGGTTSSIIIKSINEQKYSKMVKKLEKNMNQQGFWDYTRENLDILGITNQYFMKTNPNVLFKLYQDMHGEVWMTLNIYCILTLYYSSKNSDKQKQILNQNQKKDLQNNNQEQEEQKQQDINQYQQLNSEIDTNSSIQQINLQETNQNIENYEIKVSQQYQNEKQQAEKNKQQSFTQQQKSNHLYKSRFEQSDIDSSQIWPDSITYSQAWLLKKQVYFRDFAQDVQIFIKKVMSQG